MRTPRTFADVMGHWEALQLKRMWGNRLAIARLEDRLRAGPGAQGLRGGAAGPGCPGTSLCFVAKMWPQKGMRVFDLVTKLGMAATL